jgi:DNA-binding NtrC family response regulator
MGRAPAVSDARPHILIVDDDRSVAGFITEILEGAGYRTTAASSYADALAVAHRHTIDLVISDVVLGAGGDGTDLVEVIRAFQPRVGALLVSGYARSAASPEDEGILGKPFDIAALLKRVERCLTQVAILERG